MSVHSKSLPISAKAEIGCVQDSIKNWRRRARQCRASATYMTDDSLRDSLIATAKSYEAMVAHAQERAKRKSAEDGDPG